MIRKLYGVITALGLLVLFSSEAFASVDCPPGQFLKKIGSVQTSTAVISTQGHNVRAIDVQCTGTACTAGLYDATVVADSTAANLVIDVGAAASEHVLVPQTGFLEAPMPFSNGIVFVDDGNVASVTLFSCQP